MTVVKACGGLGNQMFQYATARAYSLRNSARIVFDLSLFRNDKSRDFELGMLRINNLVTRHERTRPCQEIDFHLLRVAKRFRLLCKLLKWYVEYQMFYDPALLERRNLKVIFGYFQSEKYFLHIRQTLLDEFRPREDSSRYISEYRNKIVESSSSVSLHVRRGDLLDEENFKVHGICSSEYYQSALELLEQKIGEFTLFVFSDDYKWCEENIRYLDKVLVDSSRSCSGIEDIYLMSICSHNIIANSTFSWWGAWLNQSAAKIVIAPKKWFADADRESEATDLVPSDWIRI